MSEGVFECEKCTRLRASTQPKIAEDHFDEPRLSDGVKLGIAGFSLVGAIALALLWAPWRHGGMSVSNSEIRNSAINQPEPITTQSQQTPVETQDVAGSEPIKAQKPRDDPRRFADAEKAFADGQARYDREMQARSQRKASEIAQSEHEDAYIVGMSKLSEDASSALELLRKAISILKASWTERDDQAMRQATRALKTAQMAFDQMLTNFRPLLDSPPSQELDSQGRQLIQDIDARKRSLEREFWSTYDMTWGFSLGGGG